MLSFDLAWLAPSASWYFAVFALYGLASGSTLVSGLMILMEFSAPERRPTYISVANTGVGLAAAVALLIGAALASLSYDFLFAVASVVALASLLMFRFCEREPRRESRSTLRAASE